MLPMVVVSPTRTGGGPPGSGRPGVLRLFKTLCFFLFLPEGARSKQSTKASGGQRVEFYFFVHPAVQGLNIIDTA